MKKTNKKGFTLVELLVVVVIIGVLAAVIVPNVTSSIDKAELSAAQQDAMSAYKSLVSSLDLKTETLPGQMFFFTEKYVILIKDSSLDTSFTKEIDDTIDMPKLYGSAADTFKINGKSVAANDIVVLQDGTIVRKQNGQWIDYPLMISDGQLVDAALHNAIVFAEKAYASKRQLQNSTLYYSTGDLVITLIDGKFNVDEGSKIFENAYIENDIAYFNEEHDTQNITATIKYTDGTPDSTVDIYPDSIIMIKATDSTNNEINFYWHRFEQTTIPGSNPKTCYVWNGGYIDASYIYSYFE